MLSTYVRVKDTLQHLPQRLQREEQGQDAFEYLLVIGVVMVAVVGAVAAGFTPTGLVADTITAISDKITTLIG